MSRLATEIEHRARQGILLLLQAALGGLTVFYVVAIFVNRELGLAEKLERPLTLTALLFLLTILARIERRLAERSDATIKVYSDRAELYQATRKAVEKAQRRVYVTYFRATSPTEWDAAVEQHFKACRRWAAGSPRHIFRRVVLGADSPSMLNHLRQELAAVTRAQAAKRHYSVSVLNDMARDVGAMSIGLYDDDQVFISYCSGRDRIVGIGIRSREVVRDCFDHYYDHLWSKATPIEKYLDGEAPAPAPI
ncbi:hypothetical protein AB0J55_23490 [Amycolatopsis sp. NPDC049688]|uniref:hypothetical protein n=1 Tax=Amycolatopsis sp. NPDC049688 TaxID=3154733 RepID=UPI00341EE64D